MRILQLTDLHLPDLHEAMPVSGLSREAYLERLAGALRENPSDLVVLTGDLALDVASEAVYETLSTLFAGTTGRPVVAIPGNHDRGASMERWFPTPGEVLSRGPEHCFTLELSRTRLCFLHSGPGRVASDALLWLRDQVAGSKRRVYLFMHHPPLLAGVPFMDRNYPLANGDEVVDVLDGARAGATVFCGHYHCARDLFHRQVAVHITLSTLFQLDPEAEDAVVLDRPTGCRIIDISDDVYRTWVQVLDQHDR